MNASKCFKRVSSSWLLACLLSASVLGQFAGGTGRTNDPYQIVTAEQLISIGLDPKLQDMCFVLVNDINLHPDLPNGQVFKDAVIPKFGGKFDGNGHVITNLTILADSCIGLFGEIVAGAQVKDLGVVGVDIIGTGEGIGGLVGYNNDGIVNNCYSDGAVLGSSRAGGLIGINYGTLTNSYSIGTVSGGLYVGGLVGDNHYRDSSSNASIIVGHCHSECQVFGTRDVGGLLGRNVATMGSGMVSNCYSSGTVAGDVRIGGLVGTNDGGEVINSYSNGFVSSNVAGSAGGLVGYGEPDRVVNCFWDVETSGQATSAGGTGLMTGEMKNIKTYLDAGWDFVDEIQNGVRDSWQIPDEGGYPILSVFGEDNVTQLAGKGTYEDPYIISEANEVGAVYLDPTASYELVTDLDLSGIVWSGPVVPSFVGRFNGNGFTIKRMSIHTGSYLGLFGVLERGALVHDLGVADVNVTSRGYRIGGLVGCNRGIVTNCYSTGAVSGYYDVGGLVGYSRGSDSPQSGSVVLANCHSSVTVSGYYRIGGLVGKNGGNVSNCYSNSNGVVDVNGHSNVGGLVGSNWGYVSNCYCRGNTCGNGSSIGGFVGNNNSEVTDCYSTGSVSGSSRASGFVGSNYGSVNSASCFWDTDTSGLAGGAGGTGLPTEKMQDIRTFLRAGWDFESEIQNGIRDTWRMPKGGGYPVLCDPPRFSGRGTDRDPFLISTPREIGAICFNPAASYKLTKSVDLSNITWSAAPIPTLFATFDGGGFTINNLEISGDDDLGLFGWLQKGARIQNLGVLDVNISGTRRGLSGLVGVNEGTVINCFSTGIVTGDDWYVGGLVGVNKGIVIECYSECNTSGGNYVGGLVGQNGEWGEQAFVLISNCYSSGPVSGVYEIGGLVGNNYGNIATSYSTGKVSGDGYTGGLVGWNLFGIVGSVSTSFWDMETSKQVTSAGGTGKTTPEMQTASTFLNAGWDFVDETINGTEDIWWILEGQDYPKLWRELAPEN